jgi:hypothetical protein
VQRVILLEGVGLLLPPTHPHTYTRHIQIHTTPHTLVTTTSHPNVLLKSFPGVICVCMCVRNECPTSVRGCVCVCGGGGNHRLSVGGLTHTTHTHPLCKTSAKPVQNRVHQACVIECACVPRMRNDCNPSARRLQNDCKHDCEYGGVFSQSLPFAVGLQSVRSRFESVCSRIAVVRIAAVRIRVALVSHTHTQPRTPVLCTPPPQRLRNHCDNCTMQNGGGGIIQLNVAFTKRLSA